MNLIRLSNGLALLEAQMAFCCEVPAGWASWHGCILLGVSGTGVSLLVTLWGSRAVKRSCCCTLLTLRPVLFDSETALSQAFSSQALSIRMEGNP